MKAPEVDERLEYFKIRVDMFKAACGGARNETQAAKRIAALVAYFFIPDSDLLQNGSDTEAFLQQFCYRIDKARNSNFAVRERSKRANLAGEIAETAASDLSMSTANDLSTEVRLENLYIKKLDKLTAGASTRIPPTVEEVAAYGVKKHYSAFMLGNDPYKEARRFIEYNDGRGWITDSGDPITDWRGTLKVWNDNYKRKHGYI